MWCTTGMKIFSLDKIKQHKEKNEMHKKAAEQELLIPSKSQPDWQITQEREVEKHELAIQNLMFACIHVCQQDQSLSSFESLCILEKLGVQILPGQVSGTSYRNSEAAMGVIQHISSY